MSHFNPSKWGEASIQFSHPDQEEWKAELTLVAGYKYTEMISGVK